MSANRTRSMREAAFKRQGGLCYWCEKPMLLNAEEKHPRVCTAEHLVRRRDGGPVSRTNIVAACFECNNNRDRRPVKRHNK